MAITPRTIFSSAAPATVAAVSLLAFTAVGTVAYMSMKNCPTQRTHASFHQVADGNPCSSIRKMQDSNKANWSEREWVRYALCFEQTRDSKRAAEVAGQGLKFHDDSSMLYNIKGYHEIVLDEHSDAVDTLKEGLRRAASPNGVIENNLAWAGMWAPRDLELDRAEKLYKTALDKTPNSCAFLHTGLWVEYAAAQQSDGVERYQSLRSFDKLRSRYEGCTGRLNTGEWKNLVEIAGAAVLFAELDDNQPKGTEPSKHATSGEKLLDRVAEELNTEYPGVSVDAVCQEAMPMSSTHHLCEKRLRSNIQAANQPVIESADSDRHTDKARIIIERKRDNNAKPFEDEKPCPFGNK